MAGQLPGKIDGEAGENAAAASSGEAGTDFEKMAAENKNRSKTKDTIIENKKVEQGEIEKAGNGSAASSTKEAGKVPAENKSSKEGMEATENEGGITQGRPKSVLAEKMAADFVF